MIIFSPFLYSFTIYFGNIFTIHKFWYYQTFSGFYKVSEPHRVAKKALETLLVFDEQTHQRMKYVKCGVDTIRDGYLQQQIHNLNYQVWSFAFDEKIAE